MQCIKHFFFLWINTTNIDYTITYSECSSRSIDNICSLTLLAFFESLLRIAEHTKPVTVKI